MSSDHGNLVALLRRIAVAVRRVQQLQAELEEAEKIIRQSPRPNRCLACQNVRAYDRLQAGVSDTRCAECGRGPCPWGRPLQPGEVIE